MLLFCRTANVQGPKVIAFHVRPIVQSSPVSGVQADCQPPYYHIPPTRAMFVISTKPPTGAFRCLVGVEHLKQPGLKPKENLCDSGEFKSNLVAFELSNR